jgi:hypothetical protein
VIHLSFVLVLQMEGRLQPLRKVANFGQLGLAAVLVSSGGDNARVLQWLTIYQPYVNLF